MSYTYSPGVTHSNDLDLYKRLLIAEDIDIRTIPYMDFMDAVVQQNVTDALDVRFQFPKEDTLPVYRVGEGGNTVSQNMGWFEDSTTFDKYQGKIKITEESKVRGTYSMQWEYNLDGIARGMAQAKDSEILNTLVAKAGVTESASAHWDAESANVFGDVADALQQVFEEARSNISSAELANLTIYYPAKLFMHVKNKPELWANGTSGNQGYLIPNSNQADWLGNKTGMQFRESTKLNGETYALGVIKSPRTAIHYEYTGNDMQRVRNFEDDEGSTGYIVKSWFKTYVVPQSYTQATSDRIFRISGICD